MTPSIIQNKTVLQSVQNGLLILKLFSKDKPIWGITEISKELQLPKSTVSRLIADLIKEGYLKKINRKYCLGLSILSLTGVIMSQLELHHEAFEPLKCLVKKIEETANICILEGTNLIYMLKVECKQTIRLLSHVGHPLSARRGKNKAIQAIAHKVLRIIYTLLINKQIYSEPRLAG